MAAEYSDTADALVVFGITGDLAKVMTFRSLYRLERRGLLDCPIVGVAVDDWTVEHLREHARECIEGTGEPVDDAVFERFAARLSYVSGDFADAATYERVETALGAGAAARSSTWRSRRPCSGRSSRQLGSAGAARRHARVVVEKPFGHDLASARALAAELHRYIDESQLYRIDHFLGKMGIDELLYLRFANTMLEPVWNRTQRRERADHDGRALRRRGSRALLRPGRRAARRRRQPPDAGARGGRDGAAGGRRRRSAEGRQVRAAALDRRRRPDALRARPVRRLPRRSTASRRTRPPRPTPRCAWTSTTGAGRACRSSSAPASACR